MSYLCVTSTFSYFLVFMLAGAFTLNHQMDPVSVHMKLGSVLEFTIIEQCFVFAFSGIFYLFFYTSRIAVITAAHILMVFCNLT